MRGKQREQAFTSRLEQLQVTHKYIAIGLVPLLVGAPSPTLRGSLCLCDDLLRFALCLLGFGYCSRNTAMLYERCDEVTQEMVAVARCARQLAESEALHCVSLGEVRQVLQSFAIEAPNILRMRTVQPEPSRAASASHRRRKLSDKGKGADGSWQSDEQYSFAKIHSVLSMCRSIC